MTLTSLVAYFNDILATPTTFLFIGTAVFLTVKTRFLQLRGFSRFVYLISGHMRATKDDPHHISPVKAMFTALATTIGMGNVVSPTLAIIAGGPGALFWLVIYMVLGSATKFTEVIFAINTRETTKEGFILGGPIQYLNKVNPKLAKWYGYIMVILFAGWCSLQANTLGKIWEKQLFSIPPFVTGILLSSTLLVVLFGGAKRVSNFASRLVPIMFVMYVSFSFYILFSDLTALQLAVKTVFRHIFSPAAAVGGFLGATIFEAVRWGTFRGVYITEAGVGTASIPHSLTSAKNPVDQGILSMFSVFAEIFLCILSGLIVLVTGVWTAIIPGEWSNTLVYDAFKVYAPSFGSWILLISITMFVLTTVIGNAFNGSQSFASMWGRRHLKKYYYFVALLTFLGTVSEVKFAWDLMDIMLALVAIPNLIGVIYLACKYPDLLKYKKQS